ncbi:MAG: hypothetical protein EA352_08080 [Gemmatimonadales bacterium]|nr:MAG: hypothetical protein EA352_08080 [Gemmatimonadales bacterium]
MTPTRLPTLLLFPALVLLLGVLAACGLRSASEPPEPGYSRGGVPDLRGERVLVLPLQLRSGGHEDADRELLYALESRGATVDWLGPAHLRQRAQQSPELSVDLDRLPVERFLQGDLDRIGDPLYGLLYRLGALEGANYALIPVRIRDRPVTEGEGEGEGAAGADVGGGLATAELHTALVRVRTGHVLWYGVTDGRAAAPGDLGATASTAEALARRILR